MIRNNINLTNTSETKTIDNNTYVQTNKRFTQPIIFNLLRACKYNGIAFGFYTLPLVFFFLEHYKNLSLIDISFAISLIVLCFIIRPLVTSGYIKRVSVDTNLKVSILNAFVTFMYSSFIRLIVFAILYSLNVIFNEYDVLFEFSNTVIITSIILSILPIILFLFPANLNVKMNSENLRLRYEKKKKEEQTETFINEYKKRDLIVPDYNYGPNKQSTHKTITNNHSQTKNVSNHQNKTQNNEKKSNNLLKEINRGKRRF